MQQTILALAAVLIFSLYTLSRHKADAGTGQIAVTTEIETAAAGLARTRLHEISTRAFDEADIGREGIRSTTTGLTPSSLLGPEAGEAGEANYDDLDDFHGSVRPVTSIRNGQTIAFRDSVTVRYFDAANPTSTPSSALAKEITVTVRAVGANFNGAPPVLARLRRVITPASGVAHSTN